MAKTNSWAWPNMINVAQNKVALYEDNKSITNRSKLLILTEPTELYNEPNFGVGLRKYLFTYNTENQKSIIQDSIKKQLELHEPYCIADETEFIDGLAYTGRQDEVSKFTDINKLEFTCAIKTVYQSTAEVELNTTNSKGGNF